MTVLPRYLCEGALERGEVVALPHIARAHERLLRAAGDW
jgi:hypothetical protein